METINNIVREMRERFKPYAKSESNDARYVAYLGYAEFANRIEAAHKRELAEAVAAKCEVCDVQLVTDCNQLKDWRKICADCQEGEPPKDCEYYGEPCGCNAPTMSKHPTCEKSSAVGNAAKMREVLIKADMVLSRTSNGYHSPVRQEVKEALSAPARNCDRQYQNAYDAFKHFVDETGCRVCRVSDVVDWLFAEAKGK